VGHWQYPWIDGKWYGIWFWLPGDVDEDGQDDHLIPLTINTPIMVHLLLAIIVDFDIILIRGFDRINPILPFEARVVQSMGYSHRTIFVSMAVGALAFAIGSLIDLPMIQYFCWHAFLGMFGLYVSLFTFFLGVFILLERSREYPETDENGEEIEKDADGNPVPKQALQDKQAEKGASPAAE